MTPDPPKAGGDEVSKASYVDATTRFKNGTLLHERERRGWTMKRMSEFLGVGYTLLWAYENFRIMPSEKRGLEIAAKLAITSELLWDQYADIYIAAEGRDGKKNVVRQAISKEQFQTISLSAPDMPVMIEENTFDKHLSNEDLSAALESSMSNLKPREHEMLKAYYGLPPHGYAMTYEEIGDAQNLTTERVRQILMSALRRMRHKSRSANLRAFLGQEGYGGSPLAKGQ